MTRWWFILSERFGVIRNLIRMNYLNGERGTLHCSEPQKSTDNHDRIKDMEHSSTTEASEWPKPEINEESLEVLGGLFYHPIRRCFFTTYWSPYERGGIAAFQSQLKVHLIKQRERRHKLLIIFIASSFAISWSSLIRDLQFLLDGIQATSLIYFRAVSESLYKWLLPLGLSHKPAHCKVQIFMEWQWRKRHSMLVLRVGEVVPRWKRRIIQRHQGVLVIGSLSDKIRSGEFELTGTTLKCRDGWTGSWGSNAPWQM